MRKKSVKFNAVDFFRTCGDVEALLKVALADSKNEAELRRFVALAIKGLKKLGKA